MTSSTVAVETMRQIWYTVGSRPIKRENLEVASRESCTEGPVGLDNDVIVPRMAGPPARS